MYREEPAEEGTKKQPSPPGCPTWCIGRDADAPDETDDHFHQATPALVPCVALERTPDDSGTIHHHITTTELTLVRYQYHTGYDTWLYIGDGYHGLDITQESAHRLMRALRRYLKEG